VKEKKKSGAAFAYSRIGISYSTGHGFIRDWEKRRRRRKKAQSKEAHARRTPSSRLVIRIAFCLLIALPVFFFLLFSPASADGNEERRDCLFELFSACVCARYIILPLLLLLLLLLCTEIKRLS
jgi:hypothetical protein